MDQNNTTNLPHRHNNSSKGSSLAKPISAVVLLLIFATLGFLGGISYEKSHNKLSPTVNTAFNNGSSGFSGGYGGRFNGQRPTFGTVTAISTTSISVQDSRDNTNETFAISSSTSITDNGQSVSASDIQSGDTVAVIANSTNSSQASSILVNPSYGGGGSGSAPTNTSID